MGRAFRALWKRSYSKVAELLGAVVYEDPWLAGGHNGLSNAEDPRQPEPPLPRIIELRKQMNEFGLQTTPIVMALSAMLKAGQCQLPTKKSRKSTTFPVTARS